MSYPKVVLKPEVQMRIDWMCSFMENYDRLPEEIEKQKFEELLTLSKNITIKDK